MFLYVNRTNVNRSLSSAISMRKKNWMGLVVRMKRILTRVVVGRWRERRTRKRLWIANNIR